MLLLLGCVIDFVVLVALLPAAIISFRAPADAGRLRAEAREALNFQLTAIIPILVFQLIGRFVGIAIFNAGYHEAAFEFLSIVVLINALIGLVGAVFAILAALRVRRGGGYRYPLTIRMIRDARPR